MHRFFSGSRAQEKGDVISSPLRVFGSGVLVGGMQVATVKKSTSLRMKNFGNVPPRLETLSCLVFFLSIGKGTYVANMVM